MRIVGFLVLIIGLITVSGHIVDPQSMIFCLFGTVSLLLMAFGRHMGRAFRTAFTRTRSAEALRDGIAVFERGKSFAMATGTMGTIVGLVIMLLHMDDPTAIGPGMAIAFLTHVYGLVLAFLIFAPLAASLRQRLIEAD